MRYRQGRGAILAGAIQPSGNPKLGAFGIQTRCFWSPSSVLLGPKAGAFGLQARRFWGPNSALLGPKLGAFGAQTRCFWDSRPAVWLASWRGNLLWGCDGIAAYSTFGLGIFLAKALHGMGILRGQNARFYSFFDHFCPYFARFCPFLKALNTLKKLNCLIHRYIQRCLKFRFFTPKWPPRRTEAILARAFVKTILNRLSK